MSTIAPDLPGSSPSVFRIAAWNRRRAIDRKRAAFAALDADVLVVAEAWLGFIPDPGYTMLFKGSSPAMGLAVLVRLQGIAVSMPDPLACCRTRTEPRSKLTAPAPSRCERSMGS